jgi:hypothetical protein
MRNENNGDNIPALPVIFYRRIFLMMKHMAIRWKGAGRWVLTRPTALLPPFY